MNEVQLVCAHMLDSPEPPLREAGEVLQIARQAKHRRAWLTASAASGTVAAMVLGVMTLVGFGPLGSTPTPSLPEWTTGAAPAARAAATHGHRMAQLLQAAVPSSYASATETTFSDGDVVYPTAPQPAASTQILAGAEVRVSHEEREGRLYAYLVYDGRTVRASNLCEANLGAATGSTLSCTVRDVGGVAIRVVSGTNPRYGKVFEATRYLNGGRLIVGAQQGTTADWLSGATARPLPLLTPLLDDAAIALLAGDPAMLPE